MPSRRLDDRIRELCGKALVARNSELEEIFLDLQSALHEHNEKLRKMAVQQFTDAKRQQRERRSS
jgi:hypothetical protein